MPPLFGMYNNIKDRTADHHINCMPVFIVSLCTTSRVNNNSVKKQIICCECLGFFYVDIFGNSYHDVIGRTDPDGNMITSLSNLQELDDLLGGATGNKWFEVDYTNKILSILDTTVSNSTNATSDAYRLSLYVVPAVYYAKSEGYSIDTSHIAGMSGETMDILRTIISRI